MTGVEQARVRRYTLLERALILCMAIGILIGMSTAAIAVDRQDAIREQQRQLGCIARLTADFQAAVGDALAAPPGPGPQRDQAVAEISRTARRLHMIERFC